MYMPRLSLYKPEKGNDYTFLDNTVVEMFTVGGTDVFVHKYLGPKNTDEADATPSQPRYDAVKETNIQDMLFLENRDRKYDTDVYSLRGIYNVQDIDFDMSQFGLFLQNDTLFMTIPITSSVKTLGRKVMPGDVFELPHLKDEYALNDFNVALKRFYVVEDISRAAEGFSQTWYPHLYRVKLKQIYDSQEFKEILDKDAGAGTGQTLRDVLSTYEQEMQINNAVIQQAEADAPKSGYDIAHFYTLQVDSQGKPELVTTDTHSNGTHVARSSGATLKGTVTQTIMDYNDGKLQFIDLTLDSAAPSGQRIPNQNDVITYGEPSRGPHGTDSKYLIQFSTSFDGNTAYSHAVVEMRLGKAVYLRVNDTYSMVSIVCFNPFPSF